MDELRSRDADSVGKVVEFILTPSQIERFYKEMSRKLSKIVRKNFGERTRPHYLVPVASKNIVVEAGVPELSSSRASSGNSNVYPLPSRDRCRDNNVECRRNRDRSIL